MMKNLMLLALLTWASQSFARHPVAQENMSDSESFKIEKPTKHESPKARSIAGGKFKKKEVKDQREPDGNASRGESGSEVQYWQYSE